jgi:hypothetical protein
MVSVVYWSWIYIILFYFNSLSFHGSWDLWACEDEIAVSSDEEGK